jgi:hypothetical protein
MAQNEVLSLYKVNPIAGQNGQMMPKQQAI